MASTRNILVSCDDYEAAAVAAFSSKPSGTLTYFASGAGDEETLERNRRCFDDWALLPRVLVDVSSVSTATTILGHPVSQPFGIAPSAFQRLVHPDGELGMTRAAIACNVPHCLSSSATTSLEDVAAEAKGRGLRFMQIYVLVDRAVTRRVIERAERSGFAAIVLTVDRPVLGQRDAVARAGFSISWADHGDPNRLGQASSASALHDDSITAALTWADVAWFRSITRLPIVLKGILAPADAALAVRAGAAAVWVSNHGGRQLDGVSAGVDVLPACVAAVRAAEAASATASAGPGAPRRRVEVWVDGGFRRGTDVVKALALGADFVFLGRPPLWGLAVGGEAGARDLLTAMGSEVRTAMQLLGAVDVRGITRAHVVRRGPVASPSADAALLGASGRTPAPRL